jgi:hypothetical protein
MRIEFLRPEHVEFIPKVIDPGVIYISNKFRTASHLCCCGCGTKLVTPLRETEYKLTERAGAVSLSPSIGNWNHPCQSHYWISGNRVIWAGTMTHAEIEAGRAHDDELKDAYFGKVAWPWWRRAASRIKAWWNQLTG